VSGAFRGIPGICDDQTDFERVAMRGDGMKAAAGLGFRAKLVLLALVFVLLFGVLSLLAYRVASDSEFRFERDRLVNQVHADYLLLAAAIQELFRVLRYRGGNGRYGCRPF
jgi:hypothetical protein